MLKRKDLINLGFEPNKYFGKILEEINKNGLTEKEDIEKVFETIVPKTIEPFNEPVKYQINLEYKNAFEENNYNAVLDTMNELMKVPTLINGAIMPDACPTGTIGQIPVGGVVVAKNAIHPSFHSADVCCSVMASSMLNEIDPKIILDVAEKITHFGRNGFKKKYLNFGKTFEDKLENLLNRFKQNEFLKCDRSLELAKTQLATQGDGNHFLYVGKSKQLNKTFIITHHGSRGLGALLFKKGKAVAENFLKEISPNSKKMNAWIPYNSKEGKSYWEALQLVREWTKLNHEIIHTEIANCCGTQISDKFWNEHNFVFKDGENFYHAKGATPLDNKFVPDSKNGLRIIPLNMAEPILIVKGQTTSNNIGFAPHGAGRNFSRNEHLKNYKNNPMDEIKGLDIRFYSGEMDISELPSAYKNANEVKRQIQEFGLGEIVDEIMPYGCIMAGK